jgi:hypothetical protein
MKVYKEEEEGWWTLKGDGTWNGESNHKGFWPWQGLCVVYGCDVLCSFSVWMIFFWAGLITPFCIEVMWKLISVVLPVTPGVVGQLCHHNQFGNTVLLLGVYYCSPSMYFNNIPFWSCIFYTNQKMLKFYKPPESYSGRSFQFIIRICIYRSGC